MGGGKSTLLCQGEDDLEITKEEVRRDVRRLKTGKAPGICGIVPEMLKAGGEVVVVWMTRVFNMVWREGVAPGDWRNAVIVPVYIGGRSECELVSQSLGANIEGMSYAIVIIVVAFTIDCS